MCEENKTIQDINEQQQITPRMTPNTASSEDDTPPPKKQKRHSPRAHYSENDGTDDDDDVPVECRLSDGIAKRQSKSDQVRFLRKTLDSVVKLNMDDQILNGFF